MHEKLESLVESVKSIIDSLEHSSLPYAFGGAIALSAWSEPRATVDIDLNIWISEDELSVAFKWLRNAGVEIDTDSAIAEAESRGMFIGKIGHYRVDVFIPSVPFYSEALSRRKRVTLAQKQTWVLSAECLCVFKMLFFRPKDIVDVSRLLEISGKTLDRSFVRLHLVDMMGEDDERVTKWDEIVSLAPRL